MLGMVNNNKDSMLWAMRADIALAEKKKLGDRFLETITRNQIQLPTEPHENVVQNWWYSDEEVLAANKDGKMLTLDLDIGKYCDLNCPFCFANTQSPDTDDYITKTTEKLKGLLDESAELGVRNMKIVGAGEPFLYVDLLDLIKYGNNLGIHSIVFTSGHVLGDDRKSRVIFGKKEGITSGLALAQRIKNLKASVILKFLTFDPNLHNLLVRPKSSYYAFVRYRDQGLLNLVSVGLNESKPTRLGVDCLMLRENYKEAVELFSFFNNYNIFGVFNTSMDCGNTAYEFHNPSVLTKEESLEVATSLYGYCIENKIPFDKRISPYMLSPVCSQLNHGVFVGDDTTVKACPGGPEIGVYRKGNLKDIWHNNPFRIKYKNVCGHECISRCGINLYADFEKRVRANLGIKDSTSCNTEKPEKTAA